MNEEEHPLELFKRARAAFSRTTRCDIAAVHEALR